MHAVWPGQIVSLKRRGIVDNLVIPCSPPSYLNSGEAHLVPVTTASASWDYLNDAGNHRSGKAVAFMELNKVFVEVGGPWTAVFAGRWLTVSGRVSSSGASICSWFTRLSP